MLVNIKGLFKAAGLTLVKRPHSNLLTDLLFPSSYDILAEQNKARINSKKMKVSQQFVINTVLNTICAIKDKEFVFRWACKNRENFIYETLLHIIREKSNHATPVASNEIAATLLIGG